MQLYVGNLSRETTEDELQQAFAGFGYVQSVTIVKERFSGESRGFGFIEMPNRGEAQEAMTGLNGKDMRGNLLIINEARPRNDNRRGGGKNDGRRRL
jgi:RNA recognition motif-containing protein